MLADFQTDKSEPGLDHGNSWPSSGGSLAKPARLLQTNLSDEELYLSNLLVIEQPSNIQILGIFIGSEAVWNYNEPILIQARSFDSFINNPDSAPDCGLPATKATWWGQFEKRLADLRDIAIEEDIPLSEESLAQASKFASTLVDARTPSAFLIGNGNTRLLWVNDDGEQVGLQFREKARVQYIFFKRSQGDIDEIMGLKSASTILNFIEQVGLRHLVAAC
jgi:hypothetical protein